MKPRNIGIPLERRIWLIRGRRVMPDSDLAEVYGVPTRRLNEQVKRNLPRFPGDCMFRLTRREVVALTRSRSQNATLKRGANVKYSPYAFTEHGAVMLASVLNSPVAVKASVQVVRAFLLLRRALSTREELARRLESHEQRLKSHEFEFRRLYEVLEQLSTSEPPVKPRISFSPP